MHEHRELAQAQRAHWQQTPATHPGMYGDEPSAPAVHPAAVFRTAGAKDVLEPGVGRDALYFARCGFTLQATGLEQLTSAAGQLGLDAVPPSVARHPEPAAMTAAPVPAADITVDGTGLLCVTLLLKLRNRIADAEPGTVVHVIATDPAAPLDLPAWCHMTGHTYLGPIPDHDQPVFALRLTAGARPTRTDAPWHPATEDH
jgi:tRNA 2-thiouridine synthesizing protein A